MSRLTRRFSPFDFAVFSGLSILLSAAVSDGSGFSCLKIYAPIYKFEFHDPRISGSDLLGEGEFGKVELKKNSKGQFVAYKTYKLNGNSSQMLVDYRALQFLAHYKFRFSFHIPRVEKTSNHTWIMDYHPGRTVADLVADPLLHREIKSQIEAAYTKMAHELLEFLRDQEFEIDETRVAGLIRFSASNDNFAMGSIDFIIKPDNVLVDPTSLKLILIDPS